MGIPHRTYGVRLHSRKLGHLSPLRVSCSLSPTVLKSLASSSFFGLTCQGHLDDLRGTTKMKTFLSSKRTIEPCYRSYWGEEGLRQSRRCSHQPHTAEQRCSGCMPDHAFRVRFPMARTALHATASCFRFYRLPGRWLSRRKAHRPHPRTTGKHREIQKRTRLAKFCQTCGS